MFLLALIRGSGVFTTRATRKASVRFQDTVWANLRRLSADLPSDAKVAALHYFYIPDEQTVHQQQSKCNES